MKIPIPPNVQAILDTLESPGHEAFIVGGCVRDVIRGTGPKDWDVATSATPAQVKALFLRTIDTGIKHGTITVLIHHESYEVTTYRIDGEYLDNRRPESVIFTTQIEDDLSRRDFTMNAIAYHPTQGFVDPFHGQEDIEKKIIRCVGVAENRFNEDALRMLRAIRFSAVLGFDVDEEAFIAMTTLKKNLAHISPERIREELGKLICGAYPQAIKRLEDTGLLKYVLQGRHYKGNLTHIIEKIQNCPPDEPMRLTLFLSWAESDCENILKDLRYDNKTIKEVALYIRLLYVPIKNDPVEIKKLLRQMPQESFKKLLDLKKIELENINAIRQTAYSIIAKGECFTLGDLAVNGRDLAQAGIPHGKIMGDILETLLNAVMHDPSLNKKERLLAYLHQHIHTASAF
ncbi:MAG: CCA tRNA nucleotidyltransferase [Defluviitaleaceae bacterium]|nr:CCA tRNA nucleotidyltransferase [Defluviitaleaceae bacterium]